MTHTTQITTARQGQISSAVAAAAQSERIEAEELRRLVADGKVVIPANRNHAGLAPIGIGRRLSTKVNANLGKSTISSGEQEELDKFNAATAAGADTVMDLSTGEQAPTIRAAIIEQSSVPVGTVPIYEAVSRVDEPADLTPELLLEVIDEQARDGVDYMTVHAGLLREHLPAADARKMGIVSRGGALTATWMRKHQKQNPLYDRFTDLLAICRRHDVTLSLGDGLRPGCLADASDRAQFAELETLGELVQESRNQEVQVMVEGPGHIPVDQIRMNMEEEIRVCDDAPFYILGPVVVDCAPGYDHISAAIGGTLGAYHGASMLCYVTPKEHLGLPGIDDVREGVAAFKVAAHAADVGLGVPGARERDDAISDARVRFDWDRQWQLALEPCKPIALRKESLTQASAESGENETDESETEYCSMCGPKFCPMRLHKKGEAQGES